MEKQQAIDLLKRQDIETIIKNIKENNLKVIYWETGKGHNNEEELWYINDDHIYDYLYFKNDVNLHWTVIIDELIQVIKQKINYEIE